MDACPVYKNPAHAAHIVMVLYRFANRHVPMRTHRHAYRHTNTQRDRRTDRHKDTDTQTLCTHIHTQTGIDR